MSIATFIPEIWSARLQYHLDKNLVATAFVNRDYEGDLAYGNKVHINKLGDPSVFTYTQNTDMAAPEVLATTEQLLEITEQDAFNFQIDDIDKRQARGDVANEAMARAAYKLADKVDTFLFGKMIAGAASGNHVTATADIYADFVSLAQKLDEQNVTRIGRIAAVTPATFAALLKDERFVKYSDVNAETARTAALGMVAGFTIYMSNNIATAKAVATTTQFTTYANQLSEVEAYRPEARFADAVKGLNVYGAKVTDGNGIAVLD